MTTTRFCQQYQNKILDQLKQYYHDVRELKIFFVKYCLIEKKYEAYKIWAHWLIRNLCEVNKNYHIIPDNKIVNDKDIIIHMIEKGADPQQARKFYDQIITITSNLYQKYNQIKSTQIINHDILKLMNQFVKYSVTNGNGKRYHLYQFANVYIKHNHYKYEKLLSLYRGNKDYFNFFMFELGFNYYILD